MMSSSSSRPSPALSREDEPPPTDAEFGNSGPPHGGGDEPMIMKPRASNPWRFQMEFGSKVSPPGGGDEPIVVKPRASNPRRFQVAGVPSGKMSRPSSKHRNQDGGGGRPAHSEQYMPHFSSASPSARSYAQQEQHDGTTTSKRGPFLRRPIRPPTRNGSAAGREGRARIVADWLASQGQRSVTRSACVRIDNISPTSSLAAVVEGMREAMERHGILNLDAPWDPALNALFDDGGRGSGPHQTTPYRFEEAVPPALPSLPVLTLDEDFPDDSWIVQAQVILSPFARPTGWYVRLANRSLAHALLSAAHETPLVCASRNVKIRPATPYEIDNNAMPELGEHSGRDGSSSSSSAADSSGTDQEQRRLHRQLLHVTDATLRIENCSEKTSLLKLVNLFSRYDLRQIPPWKAKSPNGPPPADATTIESTCIVPWTGRTSDGRAPPTTWLVHFRNASWARAALRELQGASLNGRALLLAQYPQQIANDDDDSNGGEVSRQRTNTDAASAV
jgi:hypothetical protein